MQLNHIIASIIAVFGFGFLGTMIMAAYTPAWWCGAGMIATLLIGVYHKVFERD
jgi:hypothetical protein